MTKGSWGAVIVLGPTILGVLIWIWLARGSEVRAVALLKNQLAESGETLNVEDLLPAPSPQASNGASIFMAACEKASPANSWLGVEQVTSMRMVAPGKAIYQPSRPTFNNRATNYWDRVGEQLKRDGFDLAALEQLIDIPRLDFDLDLKQGYDQYPVQLTRFHAACARLDAAAALDLHREDARSAVRRIRTMLAMIRGFEREPLFYFQMARFRSLTTAMDATWGLLQFPAATDEWLAEVQRDWANLEFLESGRRALDLHTAFSEKKLSEMRASYNGFCKFVPYQTHKYSVVNEPLAWLNEAVECSSHHVIGSLWRDYYSYPDELGLLRGSQSIRSSMGRAQTEHSLQSVVACRKDLSVKKPSQTDELEMPWTRIDQSLGSLYSRPALEEQDNFLRKLLAAEVERTIVVTAIALRRYQLRHGACPSELASLAPEFLSLLPCDPIDGKPLRYSKRADGSFLLYSIGEDGVDNGGDPSSVTSLLGSYSYAMWIRGRDWVWPQALPPEDLAQYERSR